MPDPLRLIAAMAAAAVMAALVPLLWRRVRGSGGRGETAAAAVLGLAVGFYLGCRMLGLWPHWPPREDQDRLLLLIVPALIAIEALATLERLPRGLNGALRLIVAGGAARVLLEGTPYLAHAAGPDSRLWTAGQIWLILAALAVSLAGVWWGLVALERGAPGYSVSLILAVACAGAGVTVVLSGYASGGQLGLPFATALGGAALANLVAKPPDQSGLLGTGAVMLFSLLVIGHFFGELSTLSGCVLLAAPLSGWLAELPFLPAKPRLLRSLLRVLLPSAIVAAVVLGAGVKFAADLQTPAGQSGAEDYYY